MPQKGVHKNDYWGVVPNGSNSCVAVVCVCVCVCASASAELVHWLANNAVWDGDRYTDREIPVEFQPEGYTPTWCNDIALLRNMAAIP